MLLLMPITRDWSRSVVMQAIAASDIPRCEALLIFDAPCDEDAWTGAFNAVGFCAFPVSTGNSQPPEGRIERRSRHLALRRFTQTLLSDTDELLLCLEDDSVVPVDVWSKLSKIGPTATGVQRTRHDGSNRVGIWQRGAQITYPPESGIANVSACGMYCLLTTCREYVQPFDGPGAVDEAQTKHMAPVVDWSCVVGHYTPTEGIIMPERPVHPESGISAFTDPNREDRADDFPAAPGANLLHQRWVGAMFRTLGRSYDDNDNLIAGAKQLIPMPRAIELGMALPNGNPNPKYVYWDGTRSDFEPIVAHEVLSDAAQAAGETPRSDAKTAVAHVDLELTQDVKDAIEEARAKIAAEQEALTREVEALKAQVTDAGFMIAALVAMSGLGTVTIESALIDALKESDDALLDRTEDETGAVIFTLSGFTSPFAAPAPDATANGTDDEAQAGTQEASDDLESKDRKELNTIATELGLTITGNKTSLVNRIREARAKAQ